MDAVTIRPARLEDLPHLSQIEKAGSELFRGTDYEAIANSEPNTWVLDPPRLLIWIAADVMDQPIAFAVVRVLTSGPHLQEIDVDPRYARQGIGRRLIEAIAQWAKAQGHSTLTLTTFRTIPWNAPYYSRLGFEIIPDEDISPALRAIRSAEAEWGLPMSDRCCMQLKLHDTDE
ncbi:MULTISPECIES: GNAT family N-acetyltransferase [unclassified Leptolyngbya]|uniref:GNAT family N-acetyltransferase n=1 Tax=unclassified Leptolyngbya TaxID=2650499 RepID=UPI001686E3EE|nr:MULTISPECIES: GNAT family N-acetyltransferase [unclassified Leptolyngbya]MBD1910763.1 GNAT family N-acetyltransferase [Leptolyngbya sp. FACHB-8]MBD2158839.1 GNAT family N-acetyltransferase [Leptolyngbya sp. FACHB-16]